jgi:hypothetical protein
MASGPKKKRGIGRRLLGIGEAEPLETDLDVARGKRYKKNLEEWKILRQDLDAAMRAYLLTGSTQKYEQFCSDTVIQGQIENAQRYRRSGVRWAFPGRDAKGKNRGNSQVVVSKEKTGGNDGRQQLAFQITETFDDHSQLLDEQNNVLRVGDGVQRVIIATVKRTRDGLFIEDLKKG